MGSLYILAGCARRLTLLPRELSRSYASLAGSERLVDGVAAPQDGKTNVYFHDGRGVRSDQRKRKRGNRAPQEVQGLASDKSLEMFLSSTRALSEHTTTSHSSRAPIFQGNRFATLDTPTRNAPRSELIPWPNPAPAHSPASTSPSAPKVDELPDAPRLNDEAGVVGRLNFQDGTLSKPVKGRVDWLSALMIEMDKAVKTSNAQLALEVWTKAQHGLDTEDNDRNLTKVNDLYTHLLSGLFQLRRAETATTVWNHMVQTGHHITKVHWTAMLHGCIRAHDASSLQGIWASMQKSDIVPDTVAWTAYICGLIKCRRWREGIEALGQLGRVWKPKPDVNTSRGSRPASSKSTSQDEPLTPSLAPINATLDALTKSGKSDLLDNVLNWASSYGIHPDTHTYNILLRPHAHSGDLAAMQSHLATMSTNKCDPDIATFTIILSSLVSSPQSSFSQLPPTEQESTIVSLLDTMHAANIPPNTYTYSSLLAALLQPPSPNRKPHDPTRPRSPPSVSSANLSAVHTVLAHMSHHSIPATPHIYTILLSHYFSQSPPNLPAIRSLWWSMQSSPGGVAKLADPILYDRMIEGLADAGEPQLSLSFVKSMVKQGKAPGWVALGKCLEGLYRSRDMDRVRWLVKGVEREGGLLKWGSRELRGRGWWQRRVAELRTEGVVREVKAVVPRMVEGGNEGGGNGGVGFAKDGK